MNMYFQLLKISLLAVLALSTYGCGTEPSQNDLIGSWKSSDGCEIILNKDSTCFVKNLNLNRLHKEYNDTCLTFTGTWKYRKHNDLGDKEYNIVIREDSIYFYISLSISGHGIWGNKPPWYLYQFIDDPDEMNQYKFVKLTTDILPLH